MNVQETSTIQAGQVYRVGKKRYLAMSDAETIGRNVVIHSRDSSGDGAIRKYPISLHPQVIVDGVK